MVADNLGQLGLPVGTLNSGPSTPDYRVLGDTDLTSSGILTGSVTLALQIDDGEGGTLDSTVVLPQSESATNTRRTEG